jgi:hypothetical protein
MTREFNLRLSATAAAVAIALAGGAQAADVLFTITETGETITFEVPKNPTSDIESYYGIGFDLYPVNVVYNGSQTSDATVYFYNNSNADGGTFEGGDLFGIGGSQYYTGDESAPTFVTGNYDNEYDFFSSQPATVSITDVSAAPEPAAWTLMLVGFGALGGALRARRGRAFA